MNIAARRVLLQKALRGAAGLVGVGLTGNGALEMPRAGWGVPQETAAAYSPERRTVEKRLQRELDAQMRKSRLLSMAVQNMDMDLQVLRSTSPTWRALVMLDRVKKRQAVLDRIHDRLQRLWEEPFAQIREEVGSWFLGDR